MTKLALPKQLASYRETLQAAHSEDKPLVTVCGGTGCRANNCIQVAEMFRNTLKKKKLDKKIDIRITGCHRLSVEELFPSVLPPGRYS